MKNYYDILGIPQEESSSGIRAAYREAVRRTHPDYAGPESAGAFADVVEAHAVLSDPERRREYNERLRREQRGKARRESVREKVTGPYPRRTAEEAVAGLAVEIILSPEEAARGGAVSFEIPLRARCDFCAGTGQDWFFACPECGGEGIVSHVQPLRVRIPDALRFGDREEIALQPVRIGNFVLTLRMSVRG